MKSLELTIASLWADPRASSHRSRHMQIFCWSSKMKSALYSGTLTLLFCLLLGKAALAQSLADNSGSARFFDAEWLDDYAMELSLRPYQSSDFSADNPLRRLDYDDYRRIVFKPEAAIWREMDIPFQLQLFHPGFLANSPVQLNLVTANHSQEITFTPAVFSYHEELDEIDADAVGGYAGFRVHHPINTHERFEEFLVFLGASYFRGVGKNQFYGLSARGLAVNTERPGDEEFPRFREFWIEMPTSDAENLQLHALLDSPSITGAFHFRVEPGFTTTVDVEVSLFPRRDIDRVGIAPLTSMFLFDATNRSAFDDFRSGVHDSEGLLIQQANGEALWRPLANPASFQVSSFGKARPLGFGLLQRHQTFEKFQDAEARYEKRPSLWIEPQGDWGEGEVILVEIPSSSETNDNIVAYWQPELGLSVNQDYQFAYKMSWGAEPFSAPQSGRVLETAAGAPAFGAEGVDERLFVIDFSNNNSINNMPTDLSAAQVNTFSSAGKITNVSASLVEGSGNYRVYVKLDPADADLIELRVALEVGGRQWGETWLYRWTR